MNCFVQRNQCNICQKSEHVHSPRPLANGFIEYRCYNCKDHPHFEGVHTWIQCPACPKTFHGRNSSSHASRHMVRQHGAARRGFKWHGPQGFRGVRGQATIQHIASPAPAPAEAYDYDLTSAADSDATSAWQGQAVESAEERERSPLLRSSQRKYVQVAGCS